MSVEQNHQSHFRNQKNQQDRSIRHHHTFTLPDSSATTHECNEEHNAANDNDQDGREAVGSHIRKDGFIGFVAIEEQNPKCNKGDSSSHKQEVEEEDQKLDKRRGTPHSECISISSLQEILRKRQFQGDPWSHKLLVPKLRRYLSPIFLSSSSMSGFQQRLP